jgi:hypothetical protein
MDLDHNRKMDWFFNEYVYGTEYPTLKFEHSFSTDPDGTLVLNYKLTQSKVSDKFAMLVPIYLDMGKGRVARLGRVVVRGNNTLEQHVRLPALKGEKPERVLIAYLDDVLASIDNK